MTFGRLFADTAFLPIYMTRLRFNTKIHLPAGDCAGRDKASAVTRVCGDSTRSTSSVGLRVILSRSFWTATNNNDENNERISYYFNLWRCFNSINQIRINFNSLQAFIITIMHLSGTYIYKYIILIW